MFDRVVNKVDRALSNFVIDENDNDQVYGLTFRNYEAYALKSSQTLCRMQCKVIIEAGRVDSNRKLHYESMMDCSNIDRL